MKGTNDHISKDCIFFSGPYCPYFSKSAFHYIHGHFPHAVHLAVDADPAVSSLSALPSHSAFHGAFTLNGQPHVRGAIGTLGTTITAVRRTSVLLIRFLVVAFCPAIALEFDVTSISNAPSGQGVIIPDQSFDCAPKLGCWRFARLDSATGPYVRLLSRVRWN